MYSFNTYALICMCLYYTCTHVHSSSVISVSARTAPRISPWRRSSVCAACRICSCSDPATATRWVCVNIIYACLILLFMLFYYSIILVSNSILHSLMSSDQRRLLRGHQARPHPLCARAQPTGVPHAAGIERREGQLHSQLFFVKNNYLMSFFFKNF